MDNNESLHAEEVKAAVLLGSLALSVNELGYLFDQLRENERAIAKVIERGCSFERVRYFQEELSILASVFCGK